MRILASMRSVPLALVALLVSCGGSAPPAPTGPIEGLVTAVEDAEGTVSSFTVDGRRGLQEILIDPQRDYGFDLAHLREHLELKQAVRVTVEVKGDDLYAVRIDDA